MGKKLITAGNFLEHVSDNRIIVTENMLITPSAKDKLRERGIEVVYGQECCSRPEETDVSFERKVVKMLIKDFGITDTSVIQKVIEKLKGMS